MRRHLQRTGPNYGAARRPSQRHENSPAGKGVNTVGMNAEKLREALNTYEDFSQKKILLEEMVESRGHLCMFYPKFHCELNPIERCCAMQKNIQELMQPVP